jgi:hypothetical protein
MGIVDRRKQLFGRLVRLRRAAREAPNNRDIVAVSSALAEELGASVSGRLAASLLGVSHTGLARWIKTGDLPVVYGTSGRVEVPVAVLLDLHEAVERVRESGRRTLHVLEPAMVEARQRGDRIRASDLVPEHAAEARGLDGHRRAELRSLAYHRALAERLDKPMVDDARHLLWKWQEQGAIDGRYAERWEGVLDRPLGEIRRIIAEDTERGRDLRQSSPFAGMLSEPERRKLLAEIR